MDNTSSYNTIIKLNKVRVHSWNDHILRVVTPLTKRLIVLNIPSRDIYEEIWVKRTFQLNIIVDDKDNILKLIKTY